MLQRVVPLDHFADALVEYAYGSVPRYATKLSGGLAVVGVEYLSYDIIICLYNNIIADKFTNFVNFLRLAKNFNFIYVAL